MTIDSGKSHRYSPGETEPEVSDMDTSTVEHAATILAEVFTPRLCGLLIWLHESYVHYELTGEPKDVAMWRSNHPIGWVSLCGRFLYTSRFSRFGDREWRSYYERVERHPESAQEFLSWHQAAYQLLVGDWKASYNWETRNGAGGRGRTDTSLRTPDFESGVSANFTTPALEG